MPAQDQQMIEGDLILRDIRDADVPVMARALNDFEVSKWTAVIPHPCREADVRRTEPDGGPFWPASAVIEWRGAPVGVIRVEDTIGYWLARAAWGQGLATRAARLMLDAYFARRTEADTVSGCVFDGNPGSVRVLEKLGFTPTTRCVSHCRARGEDLPETGFVLTRATWEARSWS
ncbi:GNAT family N-acetyltransferase [Pseudaestuariivita sp.]|uniref:GNAT family N-acetyltransferase n=1 Tax=Pseudaestuariivita sp. TaxID=2211669 RepID=UPI0040582107